MNNNNPVESASAAPTTPAPQNIEVDLQRIPLAGPAADPEAELSGLAWYGQHLILLPEKFDHFKPAQDGVLLTIPKDTLLAHVQGRTTEPIEPRRIDLIAPGVADKIPGMQGYEAIAIVGNQVFVTIEAIEDGRMSAYLVKGEIAPDLSAVVLKGDKMVKILAQANVYNAAEETLLVVGNRILTIYEANGAQLNPEPKAHVFSFDLDLIGTIPFPHIEYRVTDATDLDESGQFWVTNYLYPGDRAIYPPVQDPIFDKYGRGETHSKTEIVERLLLLRYSDTGITLEDRPPIQLRLVARGRNWEGIVRLDDLGFIVVSDMFPETWLGFVPLSGQ